MRIAKRGAGYEFRVYAGYDNKGKQIVKTMTYNPPKGLTEKQTQKAVAAAADDFERRVKGGAVVSYDKMRFKDFATGLYMRSHCSTLKAKTRKQYEIIIETRLIPFFGEMYLRDITSLDIRNWLSSLERSDRSDKDLSENSKGVWFRTLSAILGKAEEWEIIDTNPCKKIKQPRKPQSEVKSLQLSDFYKVFEKLPGYDDIRVRTLVALLLYTGMREAEAAGLQWKDIDTDLNCLHVKRTASYIPGEGVVVDTPKSAAGTRDIFFPADLSGILQKYKQWQSGEIAARGDLWKGATDDSCFLFTQFNGTPIYDSTLRSWVKKFMTWAGVPYITVHGLRHTFASLLISNGVDARTTAAQLGHNSPSLVYNTYANPQTAAQIRAAAVLGDLTAGINPVSDK